MFLDKGRKKTDNLWRQRKVQHTTERDWTKRERLSMADDHQLSDKNTDLSSKDFTIGQSRFTCRDGPPHSMINMVVVGGGEEKRRRRRRSPSKRTAWKQNPRKAWERREKHLTWNNHSSRTSHRENKSVDSSCAERCLKRHWNGRVYRFWTKQERPAWSLIHSWPNATSSGLSLYPL